MFFTQSLLDKVSEIIEIAKSKKLKIATAESCTGGLLSALFTEVSGSSQIFDRGFVTYSNESKTEILQIKKELLDLHGAVSEKVVEAMALAALKNSQANLAVAISGIAGPDGGSKEKPVGLVCIAVAGKGGVITRKFNFAGNRYDVRKSSLIAALEIIFTLIA